MWFLKFRSYMFHSGVQRSKTAALGADVIIMTISASDGWTEGDSRLVEHIKMSQVFLLILEDREIKEHLMLLNVTPMCCFQLCMLLLPNLTCSFYFIRGWQTSANSSTPMILVINKIDCAPSLSMEQLYIDNSIFRMHVQTCAVTGTGIKELEKAVLEVRGLEPVPVGGRRWTINQVEMHDDLCYLFLFFIHALFSSSVCQKYHSRNYLFLFSIHALLSSFACQKYHSRNWDVSKVKMYNRLTMVVTELF